MYFSTALLRIGPAFRLPVPMLAASALNPPAVALSESLLELPGALLGRLVDDDRGARARDPAEAAWRCACCGDRDADHDHDNDRKNPNPAHANS